MAYEKKKYRPPCVWPDDQQDNPLGEDEEDVSHIRGRTVFCCFDDSRVPDSRESQRKRNHKTGNDHPHPLVVTPKEDITYLR